MKELLWSKVLLAVYQGVMVLVFLLFLTHYLLVFIYHIKRLLYLYTLTFCLLAHTCFFFLHLPKAGVKSFLMQVILLWQHNGWLKLPTEGRVCQYSAVQAISLSGRITQILLFVSADLPQWVKVHQKELWSLQWWQLPWTKLLYIQLCQEMKRVSTSNLIWVCWAQWMHQKFSRNSD